MEKKQPAFFKKICHVKYPANKKKKSNFNDLSDQ